MGCSGSLFLISLIFRAGVYFAENSSKSNQYTVADWGNTRYLLYCRVALGRSSIHISQCSTLRRPPVWKGNMLYDSVIGESQKNNRLASLHYREVFVSSPVDPSLSSTTVIKPILNILSNIV